MFNDTEYMPFNRGDYTMCLNCGKGFRKHIGWACPGCYTYMASRNIIPKDQQYLTSDMLAGMPCNPPDTLRSIKITPMGATGSCQKGESPKDIPEWKLIRDSGQASNECVCRIPRSQCTYHKDS